VSFSAPIRRERWRCPPSAARVLLLESYVTSPPVAALGARLVRLSKRRRPLRRPSRQQRVREALSYPSSAPRFHPQMLDWVAEEISRLVHEENLAPSEIAVLAPFLSDALRFSLTERLRLYGIAVRTHRPSRELREEPPARCLLTLAKPGPSRLAPARHPPPTWPTR